MYIVQPQEKVKFHKLTNDDQMDSESISINRKSWGLLQQELGGFYYIELASEPNKKFHLQTRAANIIAIYAIPICVTQETLSSRAPSNFG